MFRLQHVGQVMDEEAPPGRATFDPRGEFPFAVKDYVPHLIAAIGQFRDTVLDPALRRIGLNVGRYRVLGVLNRFGLCTMTELANFTGIDRTTLTRIADHLVESTFAERKSDPKDRRQVKLELTGAGREVYQQGLRVVLESNSRLMRGIDDSGARLTARALQAIVGNLAPNDISRDSIIYFSRETPES
jgi:DNA-binding MarR family transcriptional regulator